MRVCWLLRQHKCRGHGNCKLHGMLEADHSHTDIERALVAFFYASSPRDIQQRLVELHRVFVAHFSKSEEHFFPALKRKGFPQETLSKLVVQQSELLALLESVQVTKPESADENAEHSRALLKAWTQHDAFENQALTTFWERVAQGWVES